jgi:hypothetical protein
MSDLESSAAFVMCALVPKHRGPGGIPKFLTLSRIICRMVLRNAFRNSALLRKKKIKKKKTSRDNDKRATHVDKLHTAAD